MQDAFKNLEKILDDEVKVYRALLDVVRREKEVLIAAQIDELNDNNRAKEAALLKLRSLERLREKAARELANQIGANAEQPRLLDLAAKLEDPYSSKLRSVHTTLDLMIKRIREINEGNEDLIRASLRTVNGALNAIKDTLQPSKTYAPTGEVKVGNVTGALVEKEF